MAVPILHAESSPHARRTPAATFVIWGLRELQCAVIEGEQCITATLPEHLQADWGDSTLVIDLTGEAEATSLPENATLVAVDSEKLLTWLAKSLRSAGRLHHARPEVEPRSVREISGPIFAAYQFPGGHTHLAGCSLGERPLVWFSFYCRDTASIEHVYLHADGSQTPDDLPAGLHLESVIPWPGKPPEFEGLPTAAMIESYAEASRQRLTNASWELLSATIVWCKFAEGTIAFAAGDAVVNVRFSGWAAELASGRQKPAPFTCPYSGIETYDIATLDDGRIVAAEAVGVCEETGQKTLQSELGTCQITGKAALAELLFTCPVSGELLLVRELAECEQCRQRISPNALREGRCEACRTVLPVSKNDPRMARLLGEYPKLDRWNAWSISETADVYVLVARGWLRRQLVVAKKDSLEVLRMASRGRFSPVWGDLTDVQREEWLR